MVSFLVVLIVAYLLGSVSNSYLTIRLVKGIDLRNEGTGNLGARNVYRIAGLRWAVVAFMGDVLKGFLAVFMAQTLLLGIATAPLWAMAFVILGHNYSVFLKGQGGKGLATAAGALLAYAPILILIVGGLGVCVLVFTHRVYLSAITMAFAFPIAIYYLNGNTSVIAATCVSLIVFSRHAKHITGRWQDL